MAYELAINATICCSKFFVLRTTVKIQKQEF